MMPETGNRSEHPLGRPATCRPRVIHVEFETALLHLNLRLFYLSFDKGGACSENPQGKNASPTRVTSNRRPPVL